MANYWEKRALANENVSKEITDESLKRLLVSYKKAIQSIDAEISKIYMNAKRLGISNNELLKTPISNKEYDKLLAEARSISDEKVKRNLLIELSADAYKSRISRLEGLKKTIQTQTAILVDNEKKITKEAASEVYRYGYYSHIYDVQKQSGVFSFALLDQTTIQKIMETKWAGQNYSSTVWKNRDILVNKLQETIIRGVASGIGERELRKELIELTNYGEYAASRILRTELAFVYNQARLEAFSEVESEEYEYFATLDLRTSETCRNLDGKRFRVDEAVVGKNYPPMHPFCRSTVISTDYSISSTRIARDAKGNNIKVPRSMKYNEWYDMYIKKTGNDWQNAAQKNLLNDKRQHTQYLKILGPNGITSDFAKFQEMKYNKGDIYAIKKREYNTIIKIKSKPWDVEFQKKAISNYYEFRELGIEMSVHALARYGSRNINIDQVKGMLDLGPNYTETEDRLIYHYDGKAIVRNQKTGEIVTILLRVAPKKEWR